MTHIITKFQRPAASLLIAFNEYSAATVYEAAGRIGQVDSEIREIVVNPGDLVLGDDDGIVIIPQNKMEEVQKSACRRVANEKDKVAALSKGITSMELNKLDKVFQSLGAVEEES